MSGDPSRVCVPGPLAEFADGFAAELARRGYRPSSVAFHLRLMAHLSRWLQGQGLVVTGLTPEVAGRFLADRREAGYVAGLAAGSLEPLLGFLRVGGVVPVPVPAAAAGPAEALLARYAGWLARERGLAETTIERNTGLLRPFASGLVRDGRLRLDGLTGAADSAFVADHARRRPAATPRMATALRSLLRFLHAEGLTGAGLAGAVPPAAGWKLAGLPKALPGEQVAALLASCDRATVVGIRDFAVLTVLARLGLRAGEAARLRLDDIDWRRGEITVWGKGSRGERLPLPADAGEAIVSYLTAARPAAGHREVFLCARAPVRPMSRGAVTNIVARAARRAGLGVVHAHRLRHSVATASLRAGGSLGEIGQLLRHKAAITTTIYAKVDIERLRALARHLGSPHEPAAPGSGRLPPGPPGARFQAGACRETARPVRRLPGRPPGRHGDHRARAGVGNPARRCPLVARAAAFGGPWFRRLAAYPR
jgi:site-specific recombinase XerD